MNRYILETEGFFTAHDCQVVIDKAEKLGFQKATINTRDGKEIDNKIRNNDKVEFNDNDLIETLNAMLRNSEIENGFPGFEFTGVNELFRVYKYGIGQEFKVHMDGTYENKETGEASKITVLIYLNNEFEGGETEFVLPHRVVVPTTGKLLLFTHKQLHKGNMVTDGFKYVLRTDLMYKKK